MSSCSIPNRAIREVASTMGKNPEEVNAICDVVNDMLGEEFDVASEITDTSILKDFVVSVNNLFKGRDKNASMALKTAITNEIKNNPTINPLKIISNIAEADARVKIKAENAKAGIRDRHNHREDEAEDGWDSKENMDRFVTAFADENGETTLESLLENVSELDEEFSGNGTFGNIINLVKSKGIGGMKVKFLKPSESVEFARNKNIKGSYKADRREIHINLAFPFGYGVRRGYRYSDVVTTIFHEAVHAITHDLMMANNEEMYKEAKKMLADIKASAKSLGIDISDYGFTSPEEMISELMNGTFVNKLSKITMQKVDSVAELRKREGLVSRIIHSIKRFFKKLFSGSNTTALKNVQKLFNDITGLDIAEMDIKIGDNATLFQRFDFKTDPESEERYKKAISASSTEALYEPKQSFEYIINTFNENTQDNDKAFRRRVKGEMYKILYRSNEEFKGMTWEAFLEKSKSWGTSNNPWPKTDGGNGLRKLLNVVTYDKTIAEWFENYVTTKSAKDDLSVDEFLKNIDQYKERKAQEPNSIMELFTVPYVREDIKPIDAIKNGVSKKRTYEVGPGLYINNTALGEMKPNEEKLLYVKDGNVYVLYNYYDAVKKAFGKEKADAFRSEIRQKFEDAFRATNGNNQQKKNLPVIDETVNNTFKSVVGNNHAITKVVYYKVKRNEIGNLTTGGIVIQTEAGAHRKEVIDQLNSTKDEIQANDGQPINKRITFNVESEQMSCFKVATAGSDIYVDLGDGSTIKFEVESIPSGDESTVTIFGKASLMKTVNYDLTSASAFVNTHELLGGERVGTDIAYDYYRKVTAVKQTVGFENYENRRNMIAEDFIKHVNGKLKTILTQRFKEDADKQTNNYMKTDIDLKIANLKPIDVLQYYDLTNIFMDLRNGYINAINQMKEAVAKKPSPTMNHRIEALETLISDSVWPTICSDVLDIIADRLQVVLTDKNVQRVKTAEEIADAISENGSEEYNIEAFEEKSLETWQESAGNKSKHTSLTVELKEFLSTIPVYENGRPKKDDLGRQIYLSENEAFVFLQNKLHDYATIEEMESALEDIVIARPQYKGLYDEIKITTRNGLKGAKNLNMRAAFFRAMRSQFRNIYVSKHDKKRVKTQDGGSYDIEYERSMQINRSSSLYAMLEQATMNIASGDVMAKAYSVYTKDGKLSTANAARLSNKITAFIDATRQGMYNGRINLFDKKGSEGFYGNLKTFTRDKEMGAEIVRKAVKTKTVELVVRGKDGRKEKQEVNVGEMLESGRPKYPQLNMLKEFYDIINDSLTMIGIEVSEDEIFDMFFDRRCKITGEGSLLYCVKDYLEWLRKYDSNESKPDFPIDHEKYKEHMRRILGCINAVGKSQVEQSTFENGKTVNSVTNTSWESTNFNNVTNTDDEKRRAYIDAEYNHYSFFFKEGNQKELLDLANRLYDVYESIGNQNAKSTVYNEVRRNGFNMVFQDLSNPNIDYNQLAADINTFIDALTSNVEGFVMDKVTYNPPQRYNCLLRELYDDAKVAGNSMLYTINHSHGKEYDDWSPAENAAEMMLQYFKELYTENGTPKENALYVGIPNPVLADAPAAEYYRIKRRFTGENANNDFDTMDVQLTQAEKDKFAQTAFEKNFSDLTELEKNRLMCYIEMMNIVRQETDRITTVRARHENRKKAKQEWERQFKKAQETENARFETEMTAYMKLSPEEKQKVTPPAAAKTFPTYKDIINPETNEPYWTEPDANYDIQTKEKNGVEKIKSVGGAEYKFFPALNNCEELVGIKGLNGTSFYDFIMFTAEHPGEYDIDKLLLSQIVKIQNAEFEKAYKNWVNDGLFKVEKDYNTGEYKLKHFGSNIPITSTIDGFIENLMKNASGTTEDSADIEDKIDLESKKKLGVTPESIEILKEYFDQSTLGICNIAQMNATDFAYYKNPNDFQKRYKEVYAPSERLCTTIPFFGKEFEKTIYLKDLELSSSKEMLESIQKILEKAGMDKQSIASIIDKFKNVNVADAQAYRSLKSYRSVKAMAGDLPLEGKVVLSRLIGDLWLKENGVIKRDENGNPMVDPQILNEDEVKKCAEDGISLEPYPDVENIKDPKKRREAEEEMSKMIATDSMYVCQTIKPFTYGQIGMKSGVKGYGDIKIGVQHKNSEFAMIWATEIGKRYAKILGLDKDSGIQLLIGLSEFMDKHDIDVVQFHSAVKVGCYGTVDVKGCYTDKIDEQGNPTGDKVFKYKKSSEFVDFLEKQIFAPNAEGTAIDRTKPREGMIKTVPYSCYGIQASTPEHLIDIEQLVGSQIRRLILADNNANTPFVINGKQYTREQLVDHYNALITENVLETMRKVDKMFSSPEEIENLLLGEMQNNAQYTPDMMRAAKLVTLPNGKKVFPLLCDPVISKKIESLLNSIIRSRITKQKIKGGACIQVACFGCEDLKVTWSKPDADGIKHPIEMECYMGAYMKDLIEPALNKDGVLDLKELKKNVDKDTYWAITHAIGYRVPTEDKYSMARLKIKGFLPPMNGSAIMLPKEITVLSGSDFDVDKMYLMLHEFRKDIVVKLDKPGKISAATLYLNSILNSPKKELYNEVYDKLSDKEKEFVENGGLKAVANCMSAFGMQDKGGKPFDEFIKSFIGVTEESLPIVRGIAKKFTKWAIKNENTSSAAAEFISMLKANNVKTINTVKVVKYKEDGLTDKKATNEVEKKEESDVDSLSDYTDIADDDYIEMNDEDYDDLVGDSKTMEELAAAKKRRLAFGDEAAKNSRAARNNRMIDVMLSVMAHPDTSSKFVNPGSFDAQKKTARMIELMNTGWSEVADALSRSDDDKMKTMARSLERNAGRNLYTELSKLSLDELTDLTKNLAASVSPINPYTQVYFHNQNEIGGKLIGAYANHNAAHAAAQYYNLTIKPMDAFEFCGRTINRLDSTDPKISKNNAGFLAASVDNVKDPVLYWLNQNLYTADVSMLLSRGGATSDEIGIFMNQPIIKKAVEMFNDAGYGNKQTIFLKAVKEFFMGTNNTYFDNLNTSTKKLQDEMKEKMKSVKNFTIDQLASQLHSTDRNSKEYYEMQMAVAVKFLHMLKVGQDLSSLTQSSKTDTQNGAAKSSIAENIVKMRKTDEIKNEQGDFSLEFNKAIFGPEMNGHFYDENGNLNKSVYDNVRDQIYDSPYSMLSAFTACGVTSTKLLFKDIFPWYQEPFQKLIDDMEIAKGGTINADELNTAFEDFMNYWMTNINAFGKDGNMTVQDRRKLYMENFGDYFLSLKSKYPEIANNPFIKALQFKYVDTVTNKVVRPEDVTNKRSWKNRIARLVVLPNVGKLTDKTKQAYISAWENMFNSDNEEIKRLAEDLVIYSYFRNGLGFAPDSFGHLAPLFRTEFTGYMENMINLVDGNAEYSHKWSAVTKFLPQFIQNHPNGRYVEKIDKFQLYEVLYNSYHKAKENGDIMAQLGIKPGTGFPAASMYTKDGKKKFYAKVMPDVFFIDRLDYSDYKKVSTNPLFYADKDDRRVYHLKPIINVDGNIYSLHQVDDTIYCYHKLPTLGMANTSEGVQFREYDNNGGDGLLSIFPENNKGIGSRYVDGKQQVTLASLDSLRELFSTESVIDEHYDDIPMVQLIKGLVGQDMDNKVKSTKQPSYIGASEKFIDILTMITRYKEEVSDKVFTIDENGNQVKLC